MSKYFKKILAVLSVFAIVLAMMPASVFAQSNSTVVLHPSVGNTVTGVKVSVGDTVSGYRVSKISGYDITVDLGKYNVNNDQFKLPKATDIWNGVDNNKVQYIICTGSGTNQRQEGAQALLVNGQNQMYYYFKGGSSQPEQGNVNATVQVVYKDSSQPSGYTLGDSKNVKLQCTSSSSYHTHGTNCSVLIKGFHPDNARVNVQAGYSWVGWNKGTINLSNIFATFNSNTNQTTNFNTGNVFYLIYESSQPTPTEPAAPNADTIKNLLGKIKVHCTNSTAGHADGEYDLIADSYTTGTVTGNATDGYTYNVTVNASKYVAKYNTDRNKEHTLVASTAGSVTATLKYIDKAWTLITPVGGITFNVICENPTTPTKPAAPSNDDLKAAEKAVKVECIANQNHYYESYGLIDETYSESTVTTDLSGNYIYKVTITDKDSYITKYKESHGNHSYTSTGSNLTVTFTYSEGKWIVAADGVAVIKVTCEASTPTDPVTPTYKTIKITKVWSGVPDDVQLPANVLITLYKDNVWYKDVTLVATSNWTAWVYVPATGEYTVDEVNVPEGYTKSVSGLTVTNTYGGNIDNPDNPNNPNNPDNPDNPGDNNNNDNDNNGGNGNNDSNENNGGDDAVDGNNGADNDNAVKTGDATDMAMTWGVFAATFLGLGGLLLRRRVHK